jgi:hypothetical protein
MRTAVTESPHSSHEIAAPRALDFETLLAWE